jgi:hypothetical protein
MDSAAGFILAVALIALVIYIVKMCKETPEQLAARLYGPLNSQMICPHCQTKGSVRTMAVTMKKGISGGKATAAVFTAGVSMLATGLSRKENCTQARCDHCECKWTF